MRHYLAHSSYILESIILEGKSMVLTNQHQKANREKNSTKKKTKLKVELSDLEVSSIVASLGKSSHDIEENLRDKKTVLWLAKIRKNLIRQAKKQGMTHPILSK